jgi:hypothetical protein
MGPVRPKGQPMHMQRARALYFGKTNRVFRQVERHLDHLTVVVLMAEIEDLSVGYQQQVTRVPRTWICLFRCVAQAVACYSEVHGEASGDDP